MLRRLLIGIGVVLIGLVAVSLALSLWLMGQPLAAPRSSPAVVSGAPCCRELIPLPTTDIQGISRHLDVLARQEPADGRDPILRALTRAEPRPTPPLTRTLNCLLVGLDRRPGRGGGGRTDTIVVAVFDRGSDHIGLISIPRDLYVVVPDHGPARVNAAYNIGRRQRRDGLEVLERVVEDTLAIPIHHSIAVDLDVFERSVDALGGVTVDVPCPIQDNFVDPRTESGRRPLDVAAGRRRMDGATAAMYIRSRHGRSDWARARRQQAVLLAMRERLLSVGGIARVPALWEQFNASVMTDMSRLDLVRLAARGLGADLTHLHGLVIGHRQTEHWTTPEGRWVLLPQFEAIDEAMGELFSAPSPGQRPAGAACPAADVAMTRPDRVSLRRRLERARQRSSGSYSSNVSASSSSSPGVTASNSDHSSSPPPSPSSPSD